MSAPKTVYVVAHDGGCEGYSEPLAAFETPELAEIFLAGARAGYSSSVKVFPLPLQDGSKQESTE